MQQLSALLPSGCMLQLVTLLRKKQAAQIPQAVSNAHVNPLANQLAFSSSGVPDLLLAAKGFVTW